MQNNIFCFHARIGTDRYRLALLPLYPKIQQLREIVKRLAVLHRAPADTQVVAQTGLSAFLYNTSQTLEQRDTNAAILYTLRTIEGVYEQAWQKALEMAGVLANSFAPYPPENCVDERSLSYQRLWSESDAEFFSKVVPSLQTALTTSLQALQKLADSSAKQPLAEMTDDSDNIVADELLPTMEQHSSALKSLYKETRLLETTEPRLKKSYMSSITLDSIDEPQAELIFPISNSRLLL